MFTLEQQASAVICAWARYIEKQGIDYSHCVWQQQYLFKQEEGCELKCGLLLYLAQGPALEPRGGF